MQHDVGTYRIKPDGSVDPAGEAGWFLQRERERTRTSIEDTVAATGIHHRHIEAIESGDLTDLPPRADTLRMVGVYAEFLGLDPQPLVLHYAQFLPRSGSYSRRRRAPRALSSATILEFPLARRLAQIAASSSRNGIVASCVGAVLMFGFASWMLAPRPEVTAMTAPQEVVVASPAETPDAAAEAPKEEAEEEHVASVTSLSEEPMDDDAPQTTASIDKEADQSADALDGLTALIEKEVPAGTQTADQPDQDRQYGSQAADSRLVIKATAPVWIRIEDGKGNVIATQTLMKGDSYRVPNQEGLVLTARDGSLLTYEVDGVAKGRLGTPGEILVGRPLDIDKLVSKG
ncbi:MAG: helix-turn-helix domain-containing protein [Parvibaculaceae bacterium]